MRAIFERLKRLIVRPVAGVGQADGARAEANAARWLAGHGLKTLERNVLCKGGEIDLVCRDKHTIVFVEVRMRQRNDYGGAAASITTAKRQRIVLAARHWLSGQRRTATPPQCRFDVMLMAHADDAQPEWIRNAFDADARV